MPAKDLNRLALLKKLEDRYIHLKDHDTLRQAALRTVGLASEPAALLRPALALRTHATPQQLAKTCRLPACTSISQVYDTAGGRLLLLGALGAGKTTLLVELALNLLARARTDATLPLPVIFDLSHWSSDETLLGYWLLDELVHNYQVPRRVAYSLVKKVEVLPLLDGLDELNDVERASCVQAINYFAWVHGQHPMVVCSDRVVEYTSQTSSLILPATVAIQNLTDEQILEYLALGGESMEALRERVEADRHLRKALCTPLMLELATLTFASRSREEIPEVCDPQGWGYQLLQDYVTCMLEQPNGHVSLEAVVPNESYQPEDAEYYLSWLAAQMRQYETAEFSAHQLRANWLPSAEARWQCRFLSGLSYSLIVGPISLLVYGLVLGPVSGLLNGLAGGLLYAVGFGYALGTLESSDKVWRWIRTRRVWGLLAGICWGLLPGMGYSPYLPRFVAVDGLTDHWIARLVLGLACGFVIGLAPAIQYRVVLLLLRRRGLVPAHLEHFLDYAADHTLLKRRGGKYLFVHELLQTYFADLMTQE